MDAPISSLPRAQSDLTGDVNAMVLRPLDRMMEGMTLLTPDDGEIIKTYLCGAVVLVERAVVLLDNVVNPLDADNSVNVSNLTHQKILESLKFILEQAGEDHGLRVRLAFEMAAGMTGRNGSLGRESRAAVDGGLRVLTGKVCKSAETMARQGPGDMGDRGAICASEVICIFEYSGLLASLADDTRLKANPDLSAIINNSYVRTVEAVETMSPRVAMLIDGVLASLLPGSLPIAQIAARRFLDYWPDYIGSIKAQSQNPIVINNRLDECREWLDTLNDRKGGAALSPFLRRAFNMIESFRPNNPIVDRIIMRGHNMSQPLIACNT